MNFCFILFWSLLGLTLFNRPLLGQTAGDLPGPGFSSTEQTSSTGETFTLSPGFSRTQAEQKSAPAAESPASNVPAGFISTSGQEGTTPAFKTVPGFSSTTTGLLTAPVHFSTTSRAGATLPPLEDFPFKPVEWGNWSVGLMIGLYHPSLDTLNRVLSDSRIGILQDPNFLLPGNPDLPTSKRNIVTPHIFGLAQYGIEGQLELNPKYSFIFAFSSWQGESRAEDAVSIFTRSNAPSSIVPRDTRYHVTINQFWWGLRYHFVNVPGVKKAYLNLGILGVSGAYLTMESLERVITPSLSFDSVSVTEASGYGFTTRFGAGGEYNFRKWLSIGGYFNYVFGKVSTLKVSRFFPSGFANPPPPNPDAPPPDPSIPIPEPAKVPVPGDSITYVPMTTVGAADVIQGDPQDLSIDLDGFEIAIFIQFHF